MVQIFPGLILFLNFVFDVLSSEWLFLLLLLLLNNKFCSTAFRSATTEGNAISLTLKGRI